MKEIKTTFLESESPTLTKIRNVPHTKSGKEVFVNSAIWTISSEALLKMWLANKNCRRN